MGKSKWFFALSGVILLVGALAIGGKGLNFGIDFEIGHAHRRPASSSRRASSRCATRSRRSAAATRRSRTSTNPELGQATSSRSRTADAEPATACRSREDAPARRLRRHAATASRARSIGPTFGEHGRQQRADRDHRVAARDLGLHRAPVRVEVRGAGADRAGARPPDHGGRLRADRPGGDDVDGRGAAHDPGLLALRHDHRVRPNTRERAAHAARGVLADRQPLDERGADAFAGDALCTLLPVARAAALRRRDAEGLRVRAARRHRVRRLLVDLHREPRCWRSGRSASPSTARRRRRIEERRSATCRHSADDAPRGRASASRGASVAAREARPAAPVAERAAAPEAPPDEEPVLDRRAGWRRGRQRRDLDADERAGDRRRSRNVSRPGARGAAGRAGRAQEAAASRRGSRAAASTGGSR